MSLLSDYLLEQRVNGTAGTKKTTKALHHFLAKVDHDVQNNADKRHVWSDTPDEFGGFQRIETEWSRIYTTKTGADVFRVATFRLKDFSPLVPDDDPRSEDGAGNPGNRAALRTHAPAPRRRVLL